MNRNQYWLRSVLNSKNYDSELAMIYIGDISVLYHKNIVTSFSPVITL